jgi:hypothetical protein
MKLRHAAALALAVWYSMVPRPILAASAKSKLSTYTNKAYGFSFQYPSDWTLKEGEPVELSWGYQGKSKTRCHMGQWSLRWWRLMSQMVAIILRRTS